MYRLAVVIAAMLLCLISPAHAAIPSTVAVTPDLRHHLDHEVSQACRARIVDVCEYTLWVPAPDPPKDPPLKYWRIRVLIDEVYTGRQKQGELLLTTLVPPPVSKRGTIVLAYGTKIQSDWDRLWGNVCLMRETAAGQYVVDCGNNNVHIWKAVPARPSP